MSDNQTCDVAIIGYGPTGATAANLLGHLGLNVIVLERDPDIYGRARAISTDEEVLRVWQQVGLAELLQQDMLPGGRIAFVDSDGVPFIEVQPDSRGSGHPPQQFIYQPSVDKVLREGVERYPNVAVMTRHEALKVIPTPTGVEVLTADLAIDGFRRVHARFVIAADGGSSATRGVLGIGYSGRTYAERWVVIDTKVLSDWEGSSRLRFHCDPERPSVDCPTPLGHHRWEFPVRDGDDESELVTDAAVWRLLDNQGVTSENVEILRAVVYSHHVRVADRWRVGRVFLAGDAAHAMPPWIGQGMASGVRDAANLCWKLHAVITGSLPESVLESYQSEREPHVRETTDHAVYAGRIVTERRHVVAAVRNHVFRLVSRVSGLQRWLGNHQWIPKAHFAHGFFAVESHPARGWQIPQPWVMDETGAVVRLDDVLNGQWTVLTTGSSAHPAWDNLGVRRLRVVGQPVEPVSDGVIDVAEVLSSWLRAHRAESIAVRPDGFVYAAASPRRSLPPPPIGLTLSARTTDHVANAIQQ